jgi:metal-responsive CopG/Arc/MetJ family transcriptional regulator
MKTKLTISIDKSLLENFDIICNKSSINKSKLLSNIIKEWCDKKEKENDK